MFTMYDAMSHERCNEYRRRSARNRLVNEVAASRRWRRRAAQARRSAEGHARATESARCDYDLAGH